MLPVKEYRQLMGDVIDERRRFLPSSEIYTADPLELAVPEPVQTGLWDVCVNRWSTCLIFCSNMVQNVKS